MRMRKEGGYNRENGKEKRGDAKIPYPIPPSANSLSAEVRQFQLESFHRLNDWRINGFTTMIKAWYASYRQ